MNKFITIIFNMSKEIKDKILATLFVVFYPAAKLYLLCKECKGRRFECFMDDWGYYLLFTFFWICAAALIAIMTYGFMYHLIDTLIPVGIIAGLIFVVIVLPIIIFKLAN